MPKRNGRSAHTSDTSQRRYQMTDIARLAGVSVSTVSRALNNNPQIPQETRDRIAELARSLNYSINIGARSLRMGRNNTVSVVIPYDANARQNMSDPFFLSILGSIADALTDAGYEMLFSRIDAECVEEVAHAYDSGRAAGIILIGQWQMHEQLNRLAEHRIPLTVWGGELPQQRYCTIGSDNRMGGKLATDHLVALGKRRIAFFGDHALPEVLLRYEGYRQSLRAHRIEDDPALCIAVPFTPEGGPVGIQRLLERGITFDAIFACSDLLAMGATLALRDHGLRVPEDIAVVGYDDIDLAQHFAPPLTTIQQSIQEAGRALVTALIQQIDGAPSPSLLLPTKLVIRSSTAL